MHARRRLNSRSTSDIRLNTNPPISDSLPGENKNRWRNYYTRCIWGIFMLLAFGTIILCGHVPVIILIVVIQTAIFKEVIGIAHQRYREKKLAWFRTINWFFLLSAYYYLFGDSFIEFFRNKFLSDRIFRTFSMRHRFVSFCLYLSGLILFVLNLKKGHYKFQFNQFGLAHMTILIVVFQSHLLIRNLFEGLYWFVFPVLLVISNDIMAYFFGFFFGKTPLIKLSPKKTWEGFIGGFISTVLIGFIAGHILSKFNYLVCPASVYLFSSCQISSAFVAQSYSIPSLVRFFILKITGEEIQFISIRPITIHNIIFSVFASLIAPFGGFFASGFKRAFKIKDFADSIPGHGGLTDRMDCQFLMGFFVYVYYSAFIKSHPLTHGDVFETIINRLAKEDQLLLYHKLHEFLSM